MHCYKNIFNRLNTDLQVFSMLGSPFHRLVLGRLGGMVIIPSLPAPWIRDGKTRINHYAGD